MLFSKVGPQFVLDFKFQRIKKKLACIFIHLTFLKYSNTLSEVCLKNLKIFSRFSQNFFDTCCNSNHMVLKIQLYSGSSIETVAFQVCEVLKIDHEFLQSFLIPFSVFVLVHCP